MIPKNLSKNRAVAVVTAAALLSSISLPALAATPDSALVMAWNIDAISTFDPAQVGEVVTNELLQNTCDSLVDFDPADESKVVPLLAKSWDVSEDRKQITFHLNEGLTFPGGARATANELAWSMQRVVLLGYGNAATLTEYGFTKENVKERITATDDNTLVLTLDNPYPTNLILQAIGANRVSALLDQKTLTEEEVDGDLGNKYLATNTACVGPYKLVQWNAGESIVLEANEDYYGTQPKLQRVLVRHVAEPGTQRLLLTQGDIDIARDLSPDDLADLDGQPGLKVERVLKPQLFFWIFNALDPVFKEEKVRLAMRYLIDYEGLGKSVMTYLGVPRASFAQLGATGALDAAEGQPFTLDLEKAKALLTEAGYPDGFEASVLFGTLPHSAPIAQSIQQNASKVGVKLNLERMANAQLFARIRGREFQSGMLAWQTGVPDAHGNASRLVYNPDNSAEAKLTQIPAWRAGFQNEEFNARVKEALLESDPEKRNQIYYQLQKDVMEKGPMAIMFQMYNILGMSDKVKDWSWNGFRVYYDTASK
ncbi:MAG: ABC transporter substrate-binding protein [Alphaproteobacteria bacterium]|nr:ABC transporter substrate-binding protein [Alphaproteobacteria bacterium]MBU1552663.1 ABC transporter substrate-binding protein [Alphaproteobacteria bacterium]MBU2339306.1 ABC transporter substrate-binding protein [Alphaproteobacteria bacterium]MBU2390018.1 ABC transporter substrate-binding protein [Alphaproteobacteria bacterium]